MALVNEVVNGDSLDELVLFPDEYFDALVTDPPCGIDLRKLTWDTDYGGRDGWIEAHRQIFTEVLRVLKPGAYALVWGIPRTAHWTATALENAGFEIRDVVTHVFGTGFPKGEALDKRIDRAAGMFDERPVIGEKEVLDYGTNPEDYPTLGGKGVRLPRKKVPLTGPASPVAKRFAGWQTSFKPAGEPWILARKPHGTSDARAIIEHGCGALNSPECGVDGTWVRNVVMSHAPDCADDACAPGCPQLDLGKAARFFPIFHHSAKPGAKERHAAGSNTHPTIKSIDLMRWLVKLITPPGGRVLDVFGGSGTTGVGAIMEGRQVVLIEREPEFADICRRRIALAEAEMGEDLLL